MTEENPLEFGRGTNRAACASARWREKNREVPYYHHSKCWRKGPEELKSRAETRTQ